VKSLAVETLSDVSMTERRDGSGTITFGPAPPFYSWFAGGGWPGLGYPAVPSFDLPDGTRQVYEMIREVQRAARQRD
jgi:hypothetical protein